MKLFTAFSRSSALAVLLLFFVIFSGRAMALQADFPEGMLEFIQNDRKLSARLFPELRDIKITPGQNFKLETRTGNAKTAVLSSSEEFQIRYDPEADDGEYYYTVQILATEERVRAEELKQELRDSGFSDLKITSGPDFYRLQSGNFTERRPADNLKEEITATGYEGWVTEMSSPGEKFQLWHQGEVTLTTDFLRLLGEFYIDGYLFENEIIIESGDTGLQIVKSLFLEDMVSRELELIQLKESRPLPAESLKSLAVIIRSRLTAEALYQESEYVAGEKYRPEKEIRPSTREAVQETEAEFLVRNNKIFPAGYYWENLAEEPVDSSREYDIIEVDEVRLSAFLDKDYHRILQEGFPEAELVSMKNLFSSRIIVDARVQRGLNYQEIRQQTWWGSRVINLLELDLNNRYYSFFPVLSEDRIAGREDLVLMGQRKQAVGGINGGFFDGTGRPLGLLIIDGQIASEKTRDLIRTTLLISAEGEYEIGRFDWQAELILPQDQSLTITGANRQPGENEAVIINSHMGGKAPALTGDAVEIYLDAKGRVQGINRGGIEIRTAPPEEGMLIQARDQKALLLGSLRTGAELKFRESLKPEPGLQGSIKHALGAGPNLVTEGKIDITAEEEKFQPDIVSGRAPRSALGLTGDNRLLLVTVDGRQPERSIGMELEELADLMIRLGAESAMNLDGGATARLLVRGFNINVPSGERDISNALLIRSDF